MLTRCEVEFSGYDDIVLPNIPLSTNCKFCLVLSIYIRLNVIWFHNSFVEVVVLLYIHRTKGPEGYIDGTYLLIYIKI